MYIEFEVKLELGLNPIPNHSIVFDPQFLIYKMGIISQSLAMP